MLQNEKILVTTIFPFFTMFSIFPDKKNQSFQSHCIFRLQFFSNWTGLRYCRLLKRSVCRQATMGETRLAECLCKYLTSANPKLKQNKPQVSLWSEIYKSFVSSHICEVGYNRFANP